jgi:hypothetical protein
MEEVGALAGRNMAHWRKGFDPEGFKQHVETSLSSKARVAAKDKSSGNPEFWIYDETDKSLVVVKRDKDGALYVGKPKGRQPNLIEGKDPNGNPILSDKVDMVVPKDAKGEVDRMIYELMIERLDMK